MDHVIDEWIDGWIDGWIKISICGSGKVFKAIITLGFLHVVFKVVQGVDVETVDGEMVDPQNLVHRVVQK